MSIVALWLVIVPFFILVPLLLGVFVYRDAKDRGMNHPLLWALAAALCPSFLGLIVYLLVRGNYTNWKCPRCGSPVRETYTACPQCGTKLKASCGNCGGAIEKDWQVCPHCATPLDWNDRDFTPPVKPQEKGVGKIILLVILVPILLLTMLFMAFSVTGSTGAVHSAHFDEEDSLRIRSSLRPAYNDWLDLCDESDAVQILVSCEEGGETDLWTYLIYLPHAVEDTIASGVGSGPFGRLNLSVEYEETEQLTGHFVCLSGWSEKEPKLEITDQYGGVAMQETRSPMDLNALMIWEEPEFQLEVEASEEVYEEHHAEEH